MPTSTKAKSKKPKSATASDARKFRADVKAILEECKKEVVGGLGAVTLSPAAEALMRAFFGPRILRRLAKGGDWQKEKKNPLIVARHLGEICAIMTNGAQVSAAVAQAAATAVRLDEHCTRGGGGRGDWCF